MSATKVIMAAALLYSAQGYAAESRPAATKVFVQKIFVSQLVLQRNLQDAGFGDLYEKNQATFEGLSKKQGISPVGLGIVANELFGGTGVDSRDAAKVKALDEQRKKLLNALTQSAVKLDAAK